MKKIIASLFVIMLVAAVFIAPATVKKADASGTYSVTYPGSMCVPVNGSATWTGDGKIANASTTSNLVLQCPITLGNSNSYGTSVTTSFYSNGYTLGTLSESFYFGVCHVTPSTGNSTCSTAANTVSADAVAYYGYPAGNNVVSVSLSSETPTNATVFEVWLAPAPGSYGWNVFNSYTVQYN